MRLLTLAITASLALSAMAAPQQVETKSQTANSAPQKTSDTPRSRQQGQKQHWNDAMNTKNTKDPREKDEYGTPVPPQTKGQGTNSSTDAQRAADPKKH
jgi:Ni/Co efflux regulator RcnB